MDFWDSEFYVSMTKPPKIFASKLEKSDGIIGIF
jgi:hypothetical protein